MRYAISSVKPAVEKATKLPFRPGVFHRWFRADLRSVLRRTWEIRLHCMGAEMHMHVAEVREFLWLIRREVRHDPVRADLFRRRFGGLHTGIVKEPGVAPFHPSLIIPTNGIFIRATGLFPAARREVVLVI